MSVTAKVYATGVVNNRIKGFCENDKVGAETIEKVYEFVTSSSSREFADDVGLPSGGKITLVVDEWSGLLEDDEASTLAHVLYGSGFDFWLSME